MPDDFDPWDFEQSAIITALVGATAGALWYLEKMERSG
jgi:hypothetical protein